MSSAVASAAAFDSRLIAAQKKESQKVRHEARMYLRVSCEQMHEASDYHTLEA